MHQSFAKCTISGLFLKQIVCIWALGLPLLLYLWNCLPFTERYLYGTCTVHRRSGVPAHTSQTPFYMLDWPWNGFEFFGIGRYYRAHTSRSHFLYQCERIQVIHFSFINVNGRFSLEISSNIGKGNITKCI